MIRGVLKVFFCYRLVVGADNFTVALELVLIFISIVILNVSEESESGLQIHSL